MTLQVTDFTVHPRTYEYDGARGLNKRSTAYVHIDGEAFWENVANRMSRPTRLWHPLVLEALKENGVTVEKMAWNPRAGCSCPCSPGFSITGDTGKDYWVTITYTEQDEVTDNPELSALRLTQLVADPTMPLGTEEQKAAAREALTEASS